VLDITVSWHSQAAVPRGSLCVENLELRLLVVLSVSEQLRSHSRVDDRRLQHPREDQVRSHSFSHPPQHLLLLCSIVVLAIPLPIRILPSFLFLLVLLASRIFFFFFELLLKLPDDLDLFFVSFSDGLFDLIFIPHQR
jgi:hypothetical protein